MDPCITSTLQNDDTVIKPDFEVVSMTQFVDYDALRLSWTDSIVTHSVMGGSVVCGPLKYFIDDMTSGSPITLDATVFTNDLVSATKTLHVQTTDPAKAVVYSLQLTVSYENYEVVLDYSKTSKLFIVEILAFC